MGDKREKRCNDPRCQGVVDFSRMFRIKINSGQSQKKFEYGYPCLKCGLLHSRKGMGNFFKEESSQMLYFEKGRKIFK
jgi:hypothetical protein